MMTALTSLGAVCSPASPMLLPNELSLQLAQSKVGKATTLHTVDPL